MHGSVLCLVSPVVSASAIPRVRLSSRCVDFLRDVQCLCLVWSTSIGCWMFGFSNCHHRLPFRHSSMIGVSLLQPIGILHSCGLQDFTNCSRHAWNAVMQLRLQALPGVWTKLRASLAHIRQSTAIRMMGWPQAFHACSVVHIGGCHFQRARSGAMRGLRTQRKGANPFLHMILTNLMGDPEAWVI